MLKSGFRLKQSFAPWFWLWATLVFFSVVTRSSFSSKNIKTFTLMILLDVQHRDLWVLLMLWWEQTVYRWGRYEAFFYNVAALKATRNASVHHQIFSLCQHIELRATQAEICHFSNLSGKEWCKNRRSTNQDAPTINENHTRTPPYERWKKRRIFSVTERHFVRHAAAQLSARRKTAFQTRTNAERSLWNKRRRPKKLMLFIWTSRFQWEKHFIAHLNDVFSLSWLQVSPTLKQDICIMTDANTTD